MEINIARDGIKDTDEPTALIYYGRYEVNTWAELYYAAVKTLYIEYPEVINSLVSKDPTRALYLRTTKIDMEQPARISTILYLDVNRKPTEIVKALREIFRHARILNINMSIAVKRSYDFPENIDDANTNESSNTSSTQILSSTSNTLNASNTSITPPLTLPDLPALPMPPILSQMPEPANSSSALDVPSFMKSESIIRVSLKEHYIERMKYFVKTYPQQMKKEAGVFLNNRRVTLAESGYRYFKEEVEVGEGLSIEVSFSDAEMTENIDYYQNMIKKYIEDL